LYNAIKCEDAKCDGEWRPTLKDPNECDRRGLRLGNMRSHDYLRSKFNGLSALKEAWMEIDPDFEQAADV
jgi:hypothetical protein